MSKKYVRKRRSVDEGQLGYSFREQQNMEIFIF